MPEAALLPNGISRRTKFISARAARGRDKLDATLLVGWAGWNAPTLCQAIATYYTDAHEREGWSAARLTPLLAVIREHLPWLKQWHNDIDPDYNERLGDFYEELNSLSTISS